MRRGSVALAAWIAAAAAMRAGAAGNDPPPELTVYAAASLRDALRELAPRAERAVGATLVINLGASNDLARQIVAAHHADVFLSADEEWMDHVARAGLVDGPSRRSLLGNRLVVVVPAAGGLALASPADLVEPAVRRLSLADPAAVPAGRYARAWLERIGLWDELRERVVPALDVRAALAAVESGAIEAGIVYRTDAATSRRVRVAFEVPADDAPRISYSVAALASRPQLERSRRLTEWLGGPEASAVFERLGFVLPEGRSP